eukprot:gnl/Chilomastix_caulleri/2791.p1 GENE.gnl/Chilomastix_caulleri/2791~~gnl/Chilomastix_caulleri/2791.p1  ORF type:complete len:79 (+),score=23.26 gnl/Chilomastix_caulleri/2791:497-733(+)
MYLCAQPEPSTMLKAIQSKDPFFVPSFSDSKEIDILRITNTEYPVGTKVYALSTSKKFNKDSIISDEGLNEEELNENQ